MVFPGVQAFDRFLASPKSVARRPCPYVDTDYPYDMNLTGFGVIIVGGLLTTNTLQQGWRA